MRNEAEVKKEEYLPPCVAVGRKQGEKNKSKTHLREGGGKCVSYLG